MKREMTITGYGWMSINRINPSSRARTAAIIGPRRYGYRWKKYATGKMASDGVGISDEDEDEPGIRARAGGGRGQTEHVSAYWEGDTTRTDEDARRIREEEVRREC
jgi:hypothetical protein